MAQPMALSSSVERIPPWTTPSGLRCSGPGVRAKVARRSENSVGSMPRVVAKPGGGTSPAMIAAISSRPLSSLIRV